MLVNSVVLIVSFAHVGLWCLCDCFDFGYVVCCVHLLLMLFAIQLDVGLISVGSSRLGCLF